jgi:hypothetical protein
MTFTTDPEELISIIPCFFIRFHSRALKRLALLATRYGSFERHLGGIADKCTDAAASYLSVIAPFARSCLTLTKEGEVELEAQVGIGQTWRRKCCLIGVECQIPEIGPCRANARPDAYE